MPSAFGASERFASRRRVSAARPRERLRALGPGALSDTELLALLLRTGSVGADACEVAEALLQRSGGLFGLRRCSLSEVSQSRGLGAAKAASVLAAVEIGRRLATRTLQVGDAIRSPGDVHRHFYARLRDAERELFLGLLLDGRHRVLREVVISQGTLTASLVHPREVFQAAVRESAAALVLVHNHPSGDPSPSPEDRAVTERLERAGELLGIRVLDHVVVAEQGYYSFQEADDLQMGSPPGAQVDAESGR